MDHLPFESTNAPVERRRSRSTKTQPATGSKKSRGRPRLNTNEEDAAEVCTCSILSTQHGEMRDRSNLQIQRRRTQIRLAQRAYRHRKDNAISSLEQQVADLQQTNDALSSELDNMYRLALANGLTLPLAEAAGATLQASEAMHSQSATIAVPSLPEASGFVSAFEDTQVSMPESLSFESVALPSHEDLSQSGYVDTGHSSNHSQNTTGWDHICHLPKPPIYSSLPGASSYAIQESTFGRRFQRTTLETAFQLLTMRYTPPDFVNSIFGFCFLFETREQIIDRMLLGMRTSADMSFDNWSYPFTHAGGIGMYFTGQTPDGHPATGPSVFQDGMPIGNQGTRQYRKPAYLTGFAMGPFGEHVERARARLDSRMQLKLRGFEGTWLDPDEIEMYLRKRKIVIPPRVEFIEAEVCVEELDQIIEPDFLAPCPPAVDWSQSLSSAQPRYCSGGNWQLQGSTAPPTKIKLDVEILINGKHGRIREQDVVKLITACQNY